MSTIRTFSEEQMRLILEHHIMQGTWRLTTYLHRNRADVARIGIERAMGLGVKVHGDKSFRLERPHLSLETMAELANGGVYQGIYDWIASGQPVYW